LNGNRKYLIRTILISSAIVGGSLLNINSATAAPGPKPIVKAAPPPPVKVTQLPSFMPRTVAPTPVKPSPPVEEKKDNVDSKITLSTTATISQTLLGLTYIVAGKLKIIPIVTPSSLVIGGLITATQAIPGSIGDISVIVGAGIGFLSIYAQATS